MNIGALHISDRFVLETLTELQGRRLTMTAISSHAEVPLATTKTAIKRLKNRGLIASAGGGRRWGYTYTVKPAA